MRISQENESLFVFIKSVSWILNLKERENLRRDVHPSNIHIVYSWDALPPRSCNEIAMVNITIYLKLRTKNVAASFELKLAQITHTIPNNLNELMVQYNILL